MHLKKLGLLSILGTLALSPQGCKPGNDSKQNDFLARDNSGNYNIIVKLTVNKENYKGPKGLPEHERLRHLELIEKLESPVCFYKSGPFSEQEMKNYNPAQALRSKSTELTPQFVNSRELVEHIRYWSDAKGIGAFIVGLGTAGICVATAGLGCAVALMGTGAAVGISMNEGAAATNINKNKAFEKTEVDMHSFRTIEGRILDFVKNKSNPYGFPCPKPSAIAEAAEITSGSLSTIPLSEKQLLDLNNSRKMVICVKQAPGTLSADKGLKPEACMSRYAGAGPTPASGDKTLDCAVDLFHACLLKTDSAAQDFSEDLNKCIKDQKTCLAR